MTDGSILGTHITFDSFSLYTDCIKLQPSLQFNVNSVLFCFHSHQ